MCKCGKTIKKGKEINNTKFKIVAACDDKHLEMFTALVIFFLN